VVNMVVEARRTGGEWFTWAGADPARIPEDEALAVFTQTLGTRHDPARMQFRLVRRTAVITDQILAEEHRHELVTTCHEGPGCG
jgi:hypothetical protein